MLKYTEVALSHLEVPGETALCIYLSGCMQKCMGCHYPELQCPDYGDWLYLNFSNIIELYLRQATCVCFLGEGKGGTAEKAELLAYADYAQGKGLKTCIYSGRDTDIEPWMTAFDFVKVGSYQPALGSLDCPATNQRMYRKDSGLFTDITSIFWI